MATMQDVARLANVSIATVSFAINNTKPVAPETRARVESAMRELGYRRNAVGRALASKRTRILALLFPALQHRFSGTVVKFFTSAAQTARENGYSLVLWPISNDDAEQAAELTSSGLVDGVLLMEVQLDDPRVEMLQASGTPFVLIGRTRDPSNITYVDIDFERTMLEAISYLVALGHSQITLLDGGIGSRGLSGYGPVVRTREAYDTEMRRRGLIPAAFSCDETPSAGHETAALVLTDVPNTTAVIIQNEHAASGFVSGLKHAGTRIPEDMSVLSIGSSPDMAAMSDPELTVMTSPSMELGRMGVEAIIDKLEDRAEKRYQELVMCRLEDGKSTATAPQRK